MEKFINDGGYVFEKTNEFPDGYEIWAIGRRNFEHKGYVPLCESMRTATSKEIP